MTRIEAAARAIASANGDDFDTIPADKAAWTAARGMFNGRFRDVNEPMQTDYLSMAGAAIASAYPELAAGTHWIAPLDATEGMTMSGVSADASAEDTQGARMLVGAIYKNMRDAYLKDHPE